MKFTQIRRLSLILLILLLLVPSIVACSNNKTDGVDNDTVSDVEESRTEPEDTFAYDEEGYVMDRLPEGLDFKRQNLNMLHWQTANEYVTENNSKDSISSALYHRVLGVQDRLNCFISIQYAPGGWSSRTDFITKVYNDVMSGQPTIDVVSHYSFAAPIGTMYGLYRNLYNVEHIDLDMPWWIDDISESVEIDGKIYFATGDIAPNTIRTTYCMFFNADLLDQYNMDVNALYDEAIDGKWTIEKLTTIVKNTYSDDGDKEVDADDTFGLAIADTPTYDGLFYGAGMRIIDKNADGSYSLSRDWAGVKTDNLVETYKALIYSNDCAPVEYSLKSFLSGKAIFLIGNFNVAINELNEAPFKYGVLPIPKYDEMQTEYGTCIAPTHSLYSVTYNTSKREMAGAVLEALASDGYRNITPAIFEEGLKHRYSQDVKDAVIYDIIRDSVMYDIGRVWGDQLNVEWRNAFGTFRNALEFRNNWMTLVAATQAPFIEGLNTVIATVTALKH